MYEKKLFKYEAAGFFAIYASAVFLHFVYDITDGNIFSILFGAVNESVWENVKIFIMPYAAWAVIELFCADPPLKQFTVAKTAGLCFLIIVNIVWFYLYTFFTKAPVLAVDIGFSAVWLAVSLALSYRLTLSDRNLNELFPIASLTLLLLLVLYFTFSVFPPKIGLFKDCTTGTYGIPVDGLLPEAVFKPVQ